jgi:4-hydroxy-tetrahydrodipicolinate reductase
MRVLLLGYGKMGQTIDGIATGRGHNITHKINIENAADLQKIQPGEVDVAIEFSQPDAAVENIKTCLLKGIPVISGTTGWLERKKEIEDLCKEKNGTFFYASNFSVGVNIFFKLNKYLAEIMNRYPEYDVKMEEIHHTEKKDAPSGTAITLAEGLLENLNRKSKWVLSDQHKQRDEISIEALRIEKVPGTHTVTYTSSIDDLEIKHTAHSRQGFALGAVLVAEWIIGKKGLLGMDDFLKL